MVALSLGRAIWRPPDVRLTRPVTEDVQSLCTSFWLVSLFLAAGELVHAQSVIRRQGTELQVNSHTIENQFAPELASDGDGDFVVTWTEQVAGRRRVRCLRTSLQLRRRAAGPRLPGQLLHQGYPSYPDIVAETNGDFVVVWQSFNQDGFGYGVFARRFDSAGAALAAEFKVNTYTPGYQSRASVASDGDGDFVVAWESTGGQDGPTQGVFARRFTSTGAALAVEFQVNTLTVHQQYGPEVAIDGDGDFVIAWEAFNHDGQGFGVFAQRFNAAGVAQGLEFQVNTYTTNNQYLPTVAADVNGNFVVAWHSLNQERVFPDGNLGIFARRFNSAGVAQAIEFQVNLRTIGAQHFPKIAADDGGDFVVTWESVNQDGVLRRRLRPRASARADRPLAASFRSTPTACTDREAQSVDWDSDGDFVVAWRNEADQDGNAIGVFAQRFSLPPLATLDVDGNGILAPLTDGLLVLRHLFSFTGGPLIANAVGANCTRCTGPEITSYMNGLGMTLNIDGNTAARPPVRRPPRAALLVRVHGNDAHRRRCRQHVHALRRNDDRALSADVSDADHSGGDGHSNANCYRYACADSHTDGDRDANYAHADVDVDWRSQLNTDGHTDEQPD